jgi:secreted PhoX family phosphatase
MTITRRDFLRSSAAVTLGYAGLRVLLAGGAGGRAAWAGEPDALARGYGPLVRDPAGLLELPEGFSYRVLSRWGETMDDGLLVPGLHDGMACFPGPPGAPDSAVTLMRNHEVGPKWTKAGPFGEGNHRLDGVPLERLYDPGGRQRPGLGGVTRVVYDPETGRTLHHELALAGTHVNCAGGAMPWNTWISCEETTQRAEGPFVRDHGYCFEVPAHADGLCDPEPIRAMGRFKHEAVAIDPSTGAVYLTEDIEDSLLYRYLPETPGDLHAGGRLQALAIVDRPSLDTRNWMSDEVAVGRTLATRWVDLEDVESPRNDLRYQGFARGAARFARGEGIHFGRGAVYFACTSGGRKRLGQVWRYTPSAHEGAPGEADAPGSLELWVEPNDGTIIQNADNLVVSPWGDVFVCEDGPGHDHLLRITPDGEVSKFARNAASEDEIAGSCFSPDGRTLFFNVQQLGLTVAIQGPWNRGRG